MIDMDNAKTVTATVAGTKRAGTSYYGNPSYDVTLSITHVNGKPLNETTQLTFRTMSNASIAYGIDNRDYREQLHEYTLTRAGRLRGAKRIEPGLYGIETCSPDHPDALTCETCGLAWLKDITPAGRCPWEYSH